MNSWSLVLWDIDVSRFLEMSKDISDLPIADISVSTDFIDGHGCTKTNDDPLDRFGDGLTLGHGGGWYVVLRAAKLKFILPTTYGN